MKKLLEECLLAGKVEIPHGKVASYIPELANANTNKIGIALVDVNGKLESAGDTDFYFTMQSIAKVAFYALALEDRGIEQVIARVGVSPSDDPFNSIVRLEEDQDHRPLNPFINAGAIMCLTLIQGDMHQKRDRVLELLKKMFHRDHVEIDTFVYLSEKETGDTNRALAYMMKGTGIMDAGEDVEDILDLYFQLCSVKVTVEDLANMAAVLSNGGVSPVTGERLISEKMNSIVMTVMFTCGLYDYSGEFAVRVGMPAKSGVGGGIIAVAKNKMGIAVANPALDSHGNSIAGVRMLELLSNEMKLNTF